MTGKFLHGDRARTARPPHPGGDGVRAARGTFFSSVGGPLGSASNTIPSMVLTSLQPA